MRSNRPESRSAKAILRSREYWAAVHRGRGDARYVVAPGADSITATIEWDHPVIGRQSASYDVSADSFRRDIAPARTLGFVHEVEALR